MPDETPVSNDKKAELLHDHYKDSFQHLLEHWKTRNRLFSLILVTLALMLFQFTSPNVLEQLANSYIRDQTKLPESDNSNGPVDFRFITSMLWFILAYLLVQYYQRSILVDRLYFYLERTEKRISQFIGTGSITLEGEFYKEERPKFLKHVFYLYKWVFLVLLVVIIIAKIIQEWRALEINTGNLTAIIFTLVDILIAVTILYYSGLYLWWPRQKKPLVESPEVSANTYSLATGREDSHLPIKEGSEL